MTFTEHLAELRMRLIRSMYAVALGFAVAYVFHNQVFELVARPLRPLVPDAPAQATTAGEPVGSGPAGAVPGDTTKPENPRPQWTVLNPLEPFLVQLRLSMYVGLVLALPVVVYQLCAFVFPGLTAQERKMARILLIGCTFFVVFGVCVAYFAVFPLVLPYLMLWVPQDVTLQLRMNETVSLIIKGMLGFAAAFQFPMVVLVLVFLDLLSPATLKKFRKFAIVLMAIIAAILTPPDPISMTVMLVPLVILYEMSIWMSYLVVRRRQAVPVTDGRG